MIPGPGIDVSHWQGAISWEQVKADGIQFAYIKATDGVSGTDALFRQNIAGSFGQVLRGGYHFFRAEGVAQQVDNFRKACGPVYPLELPPALDVEVGPFDEPELKDVLLFLNLLEEYSGLIPVLYVDLANARKITDPEFARYPLWVADYSTTTLLPDSAPRVNGIDPMFPNWTFWQHTPQGKVAGVPNAVDLDWFNGTAAELLDVGKVIPT